MSGQTLTDRIAAAQYSLTGSEVARAVCKATTHEVMGPKKKHLECKWVQVKITPCLCLLNIPAPWFCSLIIGLLTLFAHLVHAMALQRSSDATELLRKASGAVLVSVLWNGDMQLFCD